MNNNILDYQMKCVQKEWKGEKVNKIKTELIDRGHGYYSLKETIQNPYSYEDFLKEKSILLKMKRFFNSIINKK